jgi:hypothetical protein
MDATTIVVAVIGFLGVAVTAGGSVFAAKYARGARNEVRSGNGKSTGTYITDIDAKLDRVLEKQGAFAERMEAHEHRDDEQFDELRRLIGIGA